MRSRSSSRIRPSLRIPDQLLILRPAVGVCTIIRSAWRSARPPSDFGALVIQRRRWANGGLIIFPRLIELWSGGQSPRAGTLETIIRSHYLLSPALANVGVLLLLVIP